MSSKSKTIFVCTECGTQQPKWIGQCPDCGAWNTLQENLTAPAASKNRFQGYAGPAQNRVQVLADVSLEEHTRLSTGISELDRVLGGGLVSGSVVLIGGDPGIGKSTILLQTQAVLAETRQTLYVSGEESPQQVSLRAQRLGLARERLRLMPETCVELILATAAQEKPQVMVIDSVQTIFTERLQSAPGSV
ncbi:MAG: AAA family ATPase, partial [Candidatus Competibacteraceae bacterium]|nr:AAA family ATPase [Candidatus Competibacteraceae bacterium]